MKTLASSYIEGKNKLSNDEPFYLLALISFGATEDEKIYICINGNDDVIWNAKTWVGFPAEVEPIRQSKDEVPQLTIRVCNINRAVQSQIEAANGGVGAVVTFYIVYEDDLTETTNIPSFLFNVKKTVANAMWVTFTLGAPSPYLKMVPKHKMLKNFCRFGYPNSNDSRCPYTGVTYTTCNRTRSDCETRNGTDVKKFGGFPSIGKNELYRD